MVPLLWSTQSGREAKIRTDGKKKKTVISKGGRDEEGEKRRRRYEGM